MILKIVYWEFWDSREVIKQMPMMLKLTPYLQVLRPNLLWIYLGNFSEHPPCTAESEASFPHLFPLLSWLNLRQARELQLFPWKPSWCHHAASHRSWGLCCTRRQTSAHSSSFALHTEPSPQGRAELSSAPATDHERKPVRICTGIWFSPTWSLRGLAVTAEKALPALVFLTPLFYKATWKLAPANQLSPLQVVLKWALSIFS